MKIALGIPLLQTRSKKEQCEEQYVEQAVQDYCKYKNKRIDSKSGSLTKFQAARIALLRGAV
jgi:hypothetical protein